MSTFAIRNLTATPITLKLVERYKSPEHLHLQSIHGNTISRFSRNFTSIFNTTSPIPPPPTHASLASSTEKFATSEVEILVPPFTTCTTDIPAPNAVAGEKVQLTIEASGSRYRLSIPSSHSESQTFSPLSPDPQHEFSGIYLPLHTFLSIHSSAQLNSWMSNLQDATPLSALSIPGTHNSPTYHKALPSVRCQAVNIRRQLENGIRFFDIRVQPEAPTSSKLVLVHAVFPVSLTGQKTFADLLSTIFVFLDANPSETLIMSVKREGVGNMSDEQVARILYEHHTNNPTQSDRWYTKPSIPTLGAVRGKIVLMRRLAIDDSLHSHNNNLGWAIDAECWADNTAHDLHGQVCVQDFYEVLEAVQIARKIEYCKEHLQRAAECVASLPGITCDAANPVPAQPFFLNFLSASNFWKVGCWPDRIAAEVNPRMLEWLCREHAKGRDEIVGSGRVGVGDGGGDRYSAGGGGDRDDGDLRNGPMVGDGGTGIVVLDWVGLGGDWDLVRCVVSMNSRLMMREMSLTDGRKDGIEIRSKMLRGST